MAVDAIDRQGVVQTLWLREKLAGHFSGWPAELEQQQQEQQESALLDWASACRQSARWAHTGTTGLKGCMRKSERGCGLQARSAAGLELAVTATFCARGECCQQASLLLIAEET